MTLIKKTILLTSTIILLSLLVTEHNIQRADATIGNAPSGLVAQPSSSGEIKLTWDGPTNIGSYQILQYQVEYKLQSASSWTSSNTGNTYKTATITGLTNGQFYDFKVTAKLSSSQTTPSSPVLIVTPVACGTPQKFYAIAHENPTTKGVEGKIQVKAVSLCGTTNNQSYAHAFVSQYTHTTQNYVEAGIWKGYAGGLTSTGLSYGYIVNNQSDHRQNKHFIKIVNTQIGTPAINDLIKITVYFDHRGQFNGRDYYSIIINNETQNKSIQIDNVWVYKQGDYGNVHTEILNYDSSIKAEFDLMKDYDGTNWSAWTGSGSSSTQPLCNSKVDDNTYKMGVRSGSTCLLS